MDRAALRLAEPRRRLQDGVEDGLDVLRRPADHLEHLGGGGLLLERGFGLAEQACVLHGDDGLVGEALDQRDLLERERPRGRSPRRDHPDRPAIADERDGQEGAKATEPFRVRVRVGRIGVHVGNVHGAPLREGASGRRADLVRRDRMVALPVAHHGRPRAERGTHDEDVALQPVHEAVLGVGQPGGVGDDAVEDAVEIEGRPADGLKDLSGRRLAIQRLLRLVEQPNVLDRDGRLIGERSQQVDLLLGECLRIAPPQGDRSDRRASPKERRGNARSAPDLAHVRRPTRVPILLGEDVRRMHDRGFQEGPAVERCPIDRVPQGGGRPVDR